MRYILWLDDYRDPFANNGEWLRIFSPVPIIGLNVIWCKSYTEFCSCIDEKGLPVCVCFDHDLADINDTIEKTGFDCAKYLVDYCLEHDCPAPAFGCQTSNPVGRKNIESLINNYNKFYGESKKKQTL